MHKLKHYCAWCRTPVFYIEGELQKYCSACAAYWREKTNLVTYQYLTFKQRVKSGNYHRVGITWDNHLDSAVYKDRNKKEEIN